MFNDGFVESSNNDFEEEVAAVKRLILSTSCRRWMTFHFQKNCKVDYCGSLVVTTTWQRDEGDKVHEYMAICIGANRFNFRTLADLYERKLFACVKGSIENSTTLMEFAKSFNFPKLEIKCKNCIRLLVNPAFISKVHTSV